MGLELLIVDGVAIAVDCQNSLVDGELFSFSDPVSAYGKVSIFEDVPKTYQWSVISTTAGPANVLVSTSSQYLTRHEKASAWTSAQDGLLAYGIPWSYKNLSEIKHMSTSTAQDSDFWMTYHDLQSTFQLLWSLTERILLFHDGPVKRDENLGHKIGWLKDMQKHPGLKAAVAASNIERGMGVRSNLDPANSNPNRTGEFGFVAWYQMRNNVVHRGKGTRVERGALWTATVDLHNTLAYFLQHNSQPIAKLWTDLTSKDEFAYSSWLYKIQR